MTSIRWCQHCPSLSPTWWSPPWVSWEWGSGTRRVPTWRETKSSRGNFAITSRMSTLSKFFWLHSSSNIDILIFLVATFLLQCGMSLAKVSPWPTTTTKVDSAFYALLLFYTTTLLGYNSALAKSVDSVHPNPNKLTIKVISFVSTFPFSNTICLSFPASFRIARCGGHASRPFSWLFLIEEEKTSWKASGASTRQAHPHV